MRLIGAKDSIKKILNSLNQIDFSDIPSHVENKQFVVIHDDNDLLETKKQKLLELLENKINKEYHGYDEKYFYELQKKYSYLSQKKREKDINKTKKDCDTVDSQYLTINDCCEIYEKLNQVQNVKEIDLLSNANFYVFPDEILLSEDEEKYLQFIKNYFSVKM